MHADADADADARMYTHARTRTHTLHSDAHKKETAGETKEENESKAAMFVLQLHCHSYPTNSLFNDAQIKDLAFCTSSVSCFCCS